MALVYLAAAKGITYLGFLGLTGAVCAHFMVAILSHHAGARLGPLEEAMGRPVRRVAVTSALLLMGAAACRVYAQTYSVFGLDEPVTLELMQLVAFETRWGTQWLPQLSATVFAVISVGLMLLVPAMGWWMTAAAGAALAVTLPMTGHAMSYTGGAALPWALQAGHGLAAGLWLGTLTAVLATIRSRSLRQTPESDVAAASLVGSFSPLAIVAVVVVVATGLVTATLYLDSWGQLWQTSYGRTLMGKVSLMIGTCATGAYNWRIIRPRLGSSEGSRALARSGGFELGLACAVLTLTAVLVHLPLPGE